MSFVAPRVRQYIPIDGWRNGAMSNNVVYVTNNRGSNNTDMGLVIPTGSTFKLIAVRGKMRAGTDVGTWTLALGLREMSLFGGSTVDTELATNTGAESTYIYAEAVGSLLDPLATVAGGSNLQVQIYLQSKNAPSGGVTLSNVCNFWAIGVME